MNRRCFFKFLRDGWVALAAAVMVGIPEIEDKKPDFISPEIELTPRKSIPEAIAEKLRGEIPDIPIYPNHENCHCITNDNPRLYQMRDGQWKYMGKISSGVDVVFSDRCIWHEGGNLELIHNQWYPNQESDQEFDGIESFLSRQIHLLK